MEETFTGVTGHIFEQLAVQLAEKTGLKMEGPEGQIVLHGFTIAYSYDAGAETLRVRLVKKPWMVPEALIRNRVEAYFAGPGAAFAKSRGTA